MVQSIAKSAGEATQTRCVVVIYETAAVRDHAVPLCDKLIKQHSFNCDLEINWLSFAFLGETGMSADLLEKIAGASLVLFAMSDTGDLPEPVKLWTECWLDRRGERPGLVVGLLKREASAAQNASFREMYLRHIAHRAGMGYLSQSIGLQHRGIPDSLDSFNQRAGQVSSVLDRILHTY